MGSVSPLEADMALVVLLLLLLMLLLLLLLLLLLMLLLLLLLLLCSSMLLLRLGCWPLCLKMHTRIRYFRIDLRGALELL